MGREVAHVAKKETKNIARRGLVVEFGGEWIKVAKLEPAGGGAGVSQIVLERVGPEGSSAAALASAVKRAGGANEPILAYLPRQMVNIRMLDLPSVDPAEIEDMLELQIGKQTPYSKDEIVFDYHISNSARQGCSRVMLVIVQRSVIRERYYILEEASLEASRVTVSTEGLIDWCRAVAGAGAVVVLDIDIGHTDFLVVVDGYPVYSRSILMGAESLLSAGGSFEKFSKEVQQSIQAARTDSCAAQLKSVVVTGAGAKMESLVKQLGQDVGINCVAVDAMQPLKRRPKDTASADPELNKLSVASLVGASLNVESLDLNLVPDSIGLSRKLMDKAKGLSRMGVLLMAVLLGLSFWVSARASGKQQRIAELDINLGELREQAATVERQMEILKLARQRLDPAADMMNLLPSLRNSLEPGMKLERVEVDVAVSTFAVEGVAEERREITSAVRRMEDNPFFKNVQEVGTSMDRNTRKYKFQIVGALEKAK